MIKLEIVCTDKDARCIVEIIGENARTGQKGDGLVFVTPVEGVVRINNGDPWKDQRRRGIT